MIRDIFEDELTPFTLCHHYLETIDKERAKIKQIPVLSHAPSADLTEGSIGSLPSSSAGSELSFPLQNGDAAHSPSLSCMSTPLPSLNGILASAPLKSSGSLSPLQWQDGDWNDHHTTEEMGPSLQAYLVTARGRIIDNVLMGTIERHMIKRINAYFFMLNKVSEGELQCMLESSTLKHRRKELQAKTNTFEDILGKFKCRPLLEFFFIIIYCFCSVFCSRRH